MNANPLHHIKSLRPLFILLLTAGKSELYLVKSSGTVLLNLPELEQQQATNQRIQAIIRVASQSKRIPWAILVDQSEESFWGGTMPVLRGAAKRAWLERMANQSGTDSPYRWSEVQGKSRSQEGQLRVLGYTLGRPEALTPWLEALQQCGARIRGVYAPVMLANQVLKLLKVRLSSNDESIAVLVTPHESGLRQTVLVGGRVRFSRLALNPQTEGAAWFDAVSQETDRLRDYLIGNGLLKNDRVGMFIHAVCPRNSQGQQHLAPQPVHPKDQYQWLSESLPDLLYVKALAKRTTWEQLAPANYRRHDLSLQISSGIYLSTLMVALAGLIYLSSLGSQLWGAQSQLQNTKLQASSASSNYSAIAKTFPESPLNSTQLLQMSKKWASIEAEQPPDLRIGLALAGKTLERHARLVIEEVIWTAQDSPESTTTADTSPTQNTIGVMDAEKKQKKDLSSITLKGNVRGIASDDLRGTRDVLNKLQEDFKRQDKLRLEITKRPVDLSTKSNLSGSGVQDRSELSFEVKLWQQ